MKTHAVENCHRHEAADNPQVCTCGPVKKRTESNGSLIIYHKPYEYEHNMHILKLQEFKNRVNYRWLYSWTTSQRPDIRISRESKVNKWTVLDWWDCSRRREGGIHVGRWNHVTFLAKWACWSKRTLSIRYHPLNVSDPDFSRGCLNSGPPTLSG